MVSLQESLDKFKKQQQQCQSMLTSIAKQNIMATPPMSATSSMLAPSPADRVSNDTERLQHINSIKKAPVGAQIKRVIELLLERRQGMDVEESRMLCRVNANKAVFDSLKKNPKVNYDGRRFSYKSNHDVINKDQLLVRNFPEGIAITDLKDSYSNVMQDLQSLKDAGQIWLLPDFDSQEGIAHPNELKVPIKVDDDLKQLFRCIELPQDMLDIEKDLQKNGMKPGTNTAKRKAMDLATNPSLKRRRGKSAS